MSTPAANEESADAISSVPADEPASGTAEFKRVNSSNRAQTSRGRSRSLQVGSQSVSHCRGSE